MELVFPAIGEAPEAPRDINSCRRSYDTAYSFNMAGSKTTILLSIPFMIIGFLLSRAPYNMVTLPPSKYWADGPMKLITTPQFQTKKVRRSRRREIESSIG